DEDILRAAEDWRAKGRGGALATVVETWGSAPRPGGSDLGVDDQGDFPGSGSGGCVEGAGGAEGARGVVGREAQSVRTGRGGEDVWKVGLSCGGTIRVYVEKVE